MKKLIILFIVSAFLLAGCAKTIEKQWCVKNETGTKMEFSEAKEIAVKSDCVKDGNLKEGHFCNENSGTWWIDLDIKKEGCNPACVIYVENKSAEINWRCTGLILPK